jgi:hypothetical protein
LSLLWCNKKRSVQCITLTFRHTEAVCYNCHRIQSLTLHALSTNYPLVRCWFQILTLRSLCRKKTNCSVNFSLIILQRSSDGDLSSSIYTVHVAIYLRFRHIAYIATLIHTQWRRNRGWAGGAVAPHDFRRGQTSAFAPPIIN